jgi:hypothetical protein
LHILLLCSVRNKLIHSLFYHHAARGPLVLAMWVNCRLPAGGAIHLTFLID